MYYRLIVLAMILISNTTVWSQEFNCRVTVNVVTNSTSISPKIFKTLEKTIQDFVNLNKWTDKVYEPHQKINCNLIVNITEILSQDVYKCDITFQSERPVFNTTYSTQVFRHIEKDIPFQYIENDPLIFADNVFNNPLSSTLAFYCYMMLAYDLDTYSPKGGTPLFEKAENVCNVVPPNVSIGGLTSNGWQRSEGQTISGQRTKISMVLSMLNPRYEPFRLAVYQYHMSGLDQMEDNPRTAKNEILQALEKMQETNRSQPNYIINHFILSKQEELLKMYKKDPKEIKQRIISAISRIEPTLAISAERELN